VGGSPDYQNAEATSNVHIITLGAPGAPPLVRQIDSMSYARAFHNSIVLPDGKARNNIALPESCQVGDHTVCIAGERRQLCQMRCRGAAKS